MWIHPEHGVHTSLMPRVLPACFAEQAAATPHATAVRHRGREWTCAEWAAEVNRLARYLATRGVGRGALVPLVFTQRPEALLSMLAVMQAGGAYVPLDPGYGPQRIGAVLRDIEAQMLLTHSGGAKAHFDGWTGETVAIDGLDLAEFSGGPLPEETARPNEMAYLIYTSGTTGTPNGVEVTHGALMNYLEWCTSYYPVRSHGGGAVAFTSPAVDLTVTSLFVPLLVGQPVTFVSLDAPDLAPLARTLRESRERFSFLKMTPTHLRALMPHVTPAELARAVGSLILGGEPLLAEDLADLAPYVGDALRVYNEYGPTETVVGSTCHEVTRVPESGPIPIGVPIARTSVYVCDESARPVPAGEVGELFIGGAGVARGYYKRADLTARAFVRLPGAPDESVYRTGDLVRQMSGGTLEFVGRRDNQVKLRGHRIELEEIEAALRAHPAVADAAVLLERAPDRRDGGDRLVACVVPNVTRRETETRAGRMVRYSVTPSELYAHLSARLPEVMRPSAFVLLDALPTAAHGKIDRQALPALASAATHARAGHVAPRTELEEVLSAVIGRVLKVEAVGIDDNYFALGGDSIRSIQIAGEAQVRGLKVSVGDLHRFPTIRRLAEQLTDRRREFAEMPRTQPFDLIAPEDRARIPEDVEDAYPLNLLQEGMIYHRAFAAKSAVYHAMLSLLLDAPFDGAALSEVVQQLVNRHPLLRTSFDLRTFSLPLQLVHRGVRDPLRHVDLRGLSSDEQQARIDAWVEDEKRRGFEIDEFPLIRFIVHRLDERRFRLTFSYHHEIIDGWSESTMVTELLTHYLSIVNGEPAEMRAPAAVFRDSVRLEQMALESEAFRTFWERSLEGASFMRLPRLLASPHADKGQRAIVKLQFPFSREGSDRLKRLALALGVPLKSVLLAGHMKVMGLFGGSHDVLTHMVSNGRPETPDGAGVIGLFVNSFTFRQRLGRASWRELVLDTLRLEQASLPYRRYPMAELKRHQGRDPLSETLFFLIDYHVYHALQRWTNATLLDYQVYGESTFPFCATFRVSHFTSELDMQIEYDSLQFPPELVEAMADAYFGVYDAMTENTSACHHLFSLPAAKPAPAERAPLAVRGCIHHRIEERAAQIPDSVAIVCGDETISYAGLNARANQYARWLRDRGIGPEDRIALVLERSPDLVVAMLGVLKTGACYVPLDPEHRSERIAAILRATEPSSIVTHERLRDTIPPDVAEVWSVERIAREARDRSPADFDATIDPATLAYIMFTSGSTGEPKGVMVSHAALSGSTAARDRAYDEPPARFLLLSSQAFDSSVVGLYWTLAAGGTLVLPRGGGPIEVNQALNLASREAITHTLCIPSFYGSLLESARLRDLDSLSCVIVAGEECRRDLWEHHQQARRPVAFFNEYGPTEATVWSTVWRGDAGVTHASVPIGRAIANVQALILDHDGNPAPVGVAGELFVGGAHLARGYARKPAATAERFVPNPFASAEGERLYATGDLARSTLDGAIEFLGRVDYQVKVRGFRIEPAEIEAALERHPDVKRAVALAREDRTGERVLVAYVVPAIPGRLDPAALGKFAADQLPKYLIPSSFVIVDAVPLTATGKVDRQALAAVAPASDTRAARVAPRTSTEEAIAGIWSNVLSVDRVGVFDEFSALGGESLRAMRILAQIRRAFDLELPIDGLVRGQATVATLAHEVDAALWLRATQGAVGDEATVDDVVV